LRGTTHEWSIEDVAALPVASEMIARRRISKQDYTPFLRLVAMLGQ
jgi:hypothetical protein